MGNLAKGSPLIKKLIFFVSYLTRAECHRGSAKEESRWRRILEYFSSSTQIGMTATPKETKYISNLSYFGEHVYMYSLFKSS